MSSRISLLILVIANLLMPIAILCFAVGFFPYKPFLSGTAQYDDDSSDSSYRAPFDKVVFMVVDALRSDFVYGYDSGFKFTQSLIRSGAAMPFTAHANSPTITMPRVKAITTGSIPSFLDMILNFAESDTTATLAHQDTWLRQLKRKPGGKLVMYGDDTWLKLFPDTFSRADGTSSFFVSDFTEVDDNVTRHVPFELLQTDWNGFFMHYLGLDHIGHKSGPRSPHLKPKQTEMDGIVEQIFQAIESKSHLASTLLVLCGDHGMNDAGNHGGSAAGETSPALVFISPKLRSISTRIPCPPNEPENDFRYYGFVEQSDIAPTLAGLLGFPVPVNNLGVFISDFLPFWSEGKNRVQLMLRNAQQMLRIVKANFADTLFDNEPEPDACRHHSSDATHLHCLWQEVQTKVVDEDASIHTALAVLTVFMKAAQEAMSITASNYNVTKLKQGIGISAVAVLLMLSTFANKLLRLNSTGAWPAFMALGYGVMIFASSYVEEEQHFWYWIASAWITWLYLKSHTAANKGNIFRSLLIVLLLAILRVTRRWNQTGQKHAGEPDIARTFLPTHNIILWTLVIATYLDLAQRFARRGLPGVPRQASSVIAIGLCLAGFGFKVTYTKADAPELLDGLERMLLAPMKEFSLIAQARAVFLGIAVSVSFVLFKRLNRESTFAMSMESAWPIHDLLTFFLITQSRVTNVPLFLLFELQLHILGSLDLTAAEITQSSIIFQYASFFAFGGSNAISSIDLSNAYNGISGYNIIAVGLLTFLSNWAGPVWWMSATNILLLSDQYRQEAVFLRHLSLLTLFAASALLCVMLACMTLRTHLFIWTVFAPKYLYSMAWSLGQHLLINIVFGSLLLWLSA